MGVASFGFSVRSALTPARALPKMGACGLRRGRSRSRCGEEEEGGGWEGEEDGPVERPPIREAKEATAGDSAVVVSCNKRYKQLTCLG